MKLFLFSALYKHPKAYFRFEEVERQLTAAGYQVFNPLKFTHAPDVSWEKRMKIYIRVMLGCDGVALFGNYKKSRACQLLLDIAYTLKIKIALTSVWLKKKEPVLILQ